MLRYGKAEEASHIKMTNALIYSRFLFEEDVEQYMDSLRKDVIKLMCPEFDRNRKSPEERIKSIDARDKEFERVAYWMKEGSTAFAPYLRMKQKLRCIWVPA